MIPLHLRTTTIHVTPEEAERLIAADAATWLPGVPALLTNRASDSDVLAALPALTAAMEIPIGGHRSSPLVATGPPDGWPSDLPTDLS